MNVLTYGAGIALVCQVIKQTDIVPSRFMGIIALLLSLGLGYFLGLNLLDSLSMGMSAIAEYEVVKMGGSEVKTLMKK